MIDGNDLPPTTDQDVIGSATSVEDILSALAARNCPDLTSAVNKATCGNLPVTGGGFCDVYQGTMNPGGKIAIKSLRLYDKPGREDEKEKLFKRAARELYHWSKLKHHNVLPLMGLAMFRGRLSMISEWMDNGSLMSYILRNRPGDINRIGLCVDVCSGLSYLHDNYMVHGDLKAANVMVSPSGIGMIADFGNSQLKEITLRFTNTTSSSLSVRWAAPELFTTIDKPQVSKESDVYAYGMTVLETLTGKVPYDGVGDRKVLALVALSRQTPSRPTTGMSDEMWGILQLCWRWEPSDRPDMSAIGERLRDIYFRSWIGVKQTGNPEVSQFVCTSTLAPSTNSRASHTAELQGILRLAMKYREDGRLAEAESLGVEILTTQRRVLGVEHPDTLAAMADLAATYRKQGQWVKAEGLEIEEIAFRKQLLGGDHPETISCMANLASSYHEQGRLAKAEPFWAEVVAAQKQALGEGHPDTLASMASLARIYHSQGRAAEAEPLWTGVVAARKLLLGEDHPDTLSSMANLAVIYHDEGRLAEAEPILTKVVVAQKQALGTQHPDTLSSATHLAFNHREQGQWAKAEPLEIEVLASRKLLLGEDHPDTLSSTANLATIYEKQGRLAEAEELRSKVMTSQRLLLGEDDPQTHDSMTKLASIYRKQGRQAEAEYLEKQATPKELNEGLAGGWLRHEPYRRRSSAGHTPPYRDALPEPPTHGFRRFLP